MGKRFNRATERTTKRTGYCRFKKADRLSEQELAKTTLQDMRSVLYNLLETEKQKAMLANVNKDFALKVIDPAVVPEFPSKPNRKLIVFLGVVIGGLLGVAAVFFLKFIQKIKSPSK